jgi:hypothetical protein
VALRSNTNRVEPDLGEVLDDLENRLERLKRLYEQYFLGIQKIPPSQLYKEVERGIRELTQKKPRNTGLRFRLTTISQRFGSYNTYWTRTLRQIEQGTYLRDVHRVERRAYARGEDIPDEVLAKMPALMRKRVLRDRERIARRHAQAQEADAPEAAGVPAQAAERPRVHHIDESELGSLLDGDLDTDMDQLFSSIMAEEAPLGASTSAAPPAPRAPTSPEITSDEPGPGEVAAWREPAATSRGQPRPTPAARDGLWHEPGRAPPPSRPAPPTARSGQRRPATSAAALPPGMDERQARALYENYVRARKMVGASSEVSFGRLMTTLKSQAPRIMEKHRARGVEFNVVLKDNKVVVKATPKK